MAEFCHQVSKAGNLAEVAECFTCFDFLRRCVTSEKECQQQKCWCCTVSNAPRINIRCWYTRLPTFPRKAGEICFGGVLAACQGLRLIWKGRSSFSLRPQSDVRRIKRSQAVRHNCSVNAEAIGSTLSYRSKSGLIHRTESQLKWRCKELNLYDFWSVSWCHGVIVYCTQAYGRLYRTGDRGKWTAGQLEAGFF